MKSAHLTRRAKMEWWSVASKLLVTWQKALMVEGSAPYTWWAFTLNHANFCVQYAPTSANPGKRSPMSMWEGNIELQPSSRILKAPLFCKVYVQIYKEQRNKHADRAYAATYMGVDPFHGTFVVRSHHSGKLYYTADMKVHPNTFPMRARLTQMPPMHVHVEGAREMIDNNIPMHPGALAAPAQENNMAPAQDHDEEQAAIQQEIGAPIEASHPRTRRTVPREPSSRALEAMASYNIEEKTAPATLEEALAGEDAEAWRKGLQKELTSLAKHETLKTVKREHQCDIVVEEDCQH